MKSRYFWILWVSFLFLPNFANASLVSSLEDQQSMEVTVYNVNLGLIKEVREIEISEGSGELQFRDVAALIQPATVMVKSLTNPDAFQLMEQNYEYDLISEEKLLDKYVGKQIKLTHWNEYQDRMETVEATLVSNHGGPVYKIQDEIYLGYPGYKSLPQIPENLIDRPTLSWLYQNESAGVHQLELMYLTDGLVWRADYVLRVDAEDSSADLTGWVTLTNESGTEYRDARLKLVAGDVRRTVSPAAYDRRQMKVEMMAMATEPAFKEESFFEYHLYDLNRRTTLKNNQTKQINLLEASGVKLEKQYRVENLVSFYGVMPEPQNEGRIPVEVSLILKNSESHGLGMPLPAGVMRAYKEDSSGSLQFIGESQVRHTAKNEEIRLPLGSAFDVTAKKIQLSYEPLSSKKHRSEWEVTLKNLKDHDVSVDVFETFGGSWEIKDKSHDFERINAFRVRFRVAVPKGSEVKLTYEVVAGF